MAGPVRNGMKGPTGDYAIDLANGWIQLRDSPAVAGAPQDGVFRSVSVGPNTPVLADGVTPTPSGISTGKFWDQGGAVYNVNAWGARADKRTVADAAILTGTPNLSSASASFINLPVAQGGDVGKLAEVVGAAAAGLTLITTILSVQSPTLSLIHISEPTRQAE